MGDIGEGGGGLTKGAVTAAEAAHLANVLGVEDLRATEDGWTTGGRKDGGTPVLDRPPGPRAVLGPRSHERGRSELRRDAAGALTRRSVPPHAPVNTAHAPVNTAKAASLSEGDTAFVRVQPYAFGHRCSAAGSAPASRGFS